jgi:predicted RNA-binding Zn ribbon-like protein
MPLPSSDFVIISRFRMPTPAAPVRADSPWARWHVAVAETAPTAPLCLSLANTRNWRRAKAPDEHMLDYSDVLRWGEKRGLVDAGEALQLAATAGLRARVARAEFAATLALREAIYRVFSARAQGREADASDIATIGASFNDAVAQLELVVVEGKLTARARRAEPGLEAIRLHAALSAVSLLTSEFAAKVKECADDRGCGWLFLDGTRNGSRRFCFSNECGNRARQVAFRRRHHHAGTDRPLNARPTEE